MRPDRPSPRFANLMLFTAVIAVLGLRFWTSYCFFPFVEWNNVRLAPTFMLFFGSTPYPGLNCGPLTTWIYGPVPLLINLPAILASDTIGALLVAGTINLLLAIIPTILVIATIVIPETKTSRLDRAWAILLCLAVWPSTSLQYIQSDNAAIAFGLVSNLLILRTSRSHQSPLVFAGVCAALAVWSKQTSLGIIPAQLLWLALTTGRATAFRYAGVCIFCGLTLGAVFVAWFGFDALWLNMVRIPGRLPFAEDLLARTHDFQLHILGYVLLPATGLIVARRAVWRRDSPWLLPALAWVCLLPTALISIYRIGGATNSLNGFLYLLPLGALAVAVKLRHLTPRASTAWMAALTLAILTQQLAHSPLLPLRPMTKPLIEAEALSRAFPGQVYFPWHPLVTYFCEHRFDHAEDGLTTHGEAEIELSPETIRRYLPPHWSITAIPGWREREQARYKKYQPPTAELRITGKWSLYTWPQTGRPMPQ